MSEERRQPAMQKESRLRPKAMYQYAEKDIRQVSNPQDRSEQLFITAELDNLAKSAQSDNLPRVKEAPLQHSEKKIYRETSRKFQTEKLQVTPAQSKDLKSEVAHKPSSLRFESQQEQPASSLKFVQPGKLNKINPLRSVSHFPGRWTGRYIQEEISDQKDNNAGIDAIQSIELSVFNLKSANRSPHAHQMSRTIAPTQHRQVQNLRQQAEGFGKESMKVQRSSNPVMRFFQKQRIKREYVKAYRASTSATATATRRKAQQSLKKAFEKITQVLKSRAAVYAAVALVILLLVGSVASFAFSATTVMGGSIMGGLGESMRGSEGMVEVARSQLGNVGGEPYWSWYGFPYRVEWCAIFVSWVAEQDGFIAEGRFPSFAGCSVGESWFKAENAWQEGGYQPSPGEVIFFDWNGDAIPDHVGIVESSDGSYVYTIEGNWGNSVQSDVYPINSLYIHGYGTPNYYE
jgi:hypothetical protein